MISGNANGDIWSDILVIFNGSEDAGEVELPDGNWVLVGDGAQISEAGLSVMTGSIKVPAYSAYILHN
jgi:hypothetical protein